MTTATLHDSHPLANPRRVRMFLAEKGLGDAVTCRQWDAFKGEHKSDAYLKINPAGLLPALELEDGRCIAETMAIARYFEALKPEPALMGRDAMEQATIEMWQRRAESGLMGNTGAYFHNATAGLGDNGRYRNKEWGEQSVDKLKAALTLFEAQLGRYPYVAGPEFSVADITALCSIDFALFCGIVSLDDYPNLKRWHTLVSSRPSAKA